MKKGFFKNGLFYVVVFLAIIGLASWVTRDSSSGQYTGLSTGEFVQQLEDNRIESFTVQPSAGILEIRGKYRKGQEADISSNENVNVFGNSGKTATEFQTAILQNDSETIGQVTTIARNKNVEMVPVREETSGIWMTLLVSFLPLVVFIGFIYMMMGQSGQGGGGGGGRGVMNF